MEYIIELRYETAWALFGCGIKNECSKVDAVFVKNNKIII